LRNVSERFLEKVAEPDANGCWLWQAATHPSGHGQFKLQGQMCPAHRVAYELFVGEIPEGHEVHHECECRGCVNPDHLLPLPVSTHRRLRRVTSCKQGHPWTEGNLYGSKRKQCATCSRAASARYYARKRGLA
jgi:HNH endonuclease